VQLGQIAGRDGRKGIEVGLEIEQGTEKLAALALVAHEGGLDDDQLTAAERLGDLRDRRHLEEPPDRRDLVRHIGGPLGPAIEHLDGALRRPDEPARERLGDRVERDLDLRDDPEAPTAAAERPEEIRVGVRSAWTTSPSAVTTTAESTLEAESPCFRASQPIPPPRE
jgi:hypothetical protein